MMPKMYIDIEVLSHGDTVDMNPPMLRGQLLAKLHPLFSAAPHCYAISLPLLRAGTARGVVRVFATCRDDLDALVAQLMLMPWMRDYARVEYPVVVPEDFAGPWVAFCRYRVPTLKADRKAGDAYGTLRQRRMDTMRQEGMDYFILHSKTTGQRFTLAVQKCAGSAPSADCLPNSYGLCSKHNFFCVPDIP